MCTTTPETPGDVDGQNALYRQLMADRNVPEAQINMMINMFEKAPGFQRQGMLQQLLDELKD